ncbi:MAG: (d)CMP kinase [Planctomycetota bacterium]|nr:(d)CMP kinase [Planctomycetota bacterium]
MEDGPLVIAIDGPAGAGKSTIARRVAEDLGWAYLDTGAMYRAVTLVALELEVPLEDAEALAALAADLPLHLAPDGTVTVREQDVTALIRTAEITAAVSVVASVQAVREVMVRHQRRFAAQNGRIVAEGRDMGTEVFPDAHLKVYLDADPGERARRRLAQGSEQEGGEDLEAMRSKIEARDRLDSTREASPLRPADDAWRLDTTRMTPDEVFEAVRSRVRSAIRS